MMRQAISPRLATSTQRNIFAALHPEDAEAGLDFRRIAHRSQRQTEYAPCLGRIDDAIVPQAGAGVIRMSLALKLVAQPTNETGFLLGRQAPALGLPLLAAASQQHIGRLLTAHHRGARVGPLEQ